MADTIQIHMDDLTIGEVILVEEMVGLPMDKLGSGPSRGRLALALVLVHLRRSDPDATEADALGVRMGRVELMAAGDNAASFGEEPADPQ